MPTRKKLLQIQKRLETRLMEYQCKKTDNTIFIGSQLLKNRMLTLYKALEKQVTSDKASGTEKAKCAEIATNIAIDVLKRESECIKAVKQGSGLMAEMAAKAARSSLSVNLDRDPMDELGKSCW